MKRRLAPPPFHAPIRKRPSEESPLEIAQRRGNTVAVELLLAAGAVAAPAEGRAGVAAEPTQA